MSELGPIEKVKVWEFLKEKHSVLANRLQSTDAKESGFVSIDGLPNESRQFLWQSLKRWKPAVAELLSTDETVLAMRTVFPTGRIGIETSELIGAVWFEINGSGKSQNRYAKVS
jgi:hypothetical protein